MLDSRVSTKISTTEITVSVSVNEPLIPDHGHIGRATRLVMTFTHSPGYVPEYLPAGNSVPGKSRQAY